MDGQDVCFELAKEDLEIGVFKNTRNVSFINVKLSRKVPQITL